MLAVIVTGPPGAGKSTVATEVQDALGAAGVANALIEEDELHRCYPPLERDRAFAHMRMLSRSFRDAGHELLFVTATVEDEAYRDALLSAVGADEHLLVRLEAAPATLERRIRAREPATWAGLEQLVAAAHELAATMPSLPGVHLVLDTERLTPAAAAARIGAALDPRHTRRAPH